MRLPSALRSPAWLFGVLVSLGSSASAWADSATMAADFARIRGQATRLAGRPGDIPQRVNELRRIYRDSAGNHAFPIVAAHGALWGYWFFQVTGPIGAWITAESFFEPSEGRRLRGEIETFSTSFKDANRQVFVDTYTNYYFTKEHGSEAGAEAYVQPELLSALNQVHAARASGRPLDEAAKRRVFDLALRHEQEVTVGPRVVKAVAEFDAPLLLREIVLKPVVHFSYFPRGTNLFFWDFSDKEERIENATRSYELAVHAGWPAVEAAISSYYVPGVD